MPDFTITVKHTVTADTEDEALDQWAEGDTEEHEVIDVTEEGKKECEDCMNEFNEKQGRPYKYEPSVWLCDDCHDARMEE